MILDSRRNIKIFALSTCLWIQIHTTETNAFAIIPLPSLHNLPEYITDTAKNSFPLDRRVSTSRIKYNASNQHTNRHRQSQSQSCALFAHAGNGNDNRNKSNTARESAVIVEWEPVTLSELERRIDEGINYQKCREKEGDIHAHEDRHQGIFCGYKVTEEEVSRLKSANPDDYSP